MNSLEKLQKILGLVYQLNKETDHDWFFDFSGHVDIISVHYVKTVKKKCKKCDSEKKTEMVWLAQCTNVTSQTSLNNLIKELESHLIK